MPSGRCGARIRIWRLGGESMGLEQSVLAQARSPLGRRSRPSALDVGRFFDEFLHLRGTIVKPETARLMLKNHNPPSLALRGLGFALGDQDGCSEGKRLATAERPVPLAWADPATDTTCVVLTTLPSQAVSPHPPNVGVQNRCRCGKRVVRPL